MSKTETLTLFSKTEMRQILSKTEMRQILAKKKILHIRMDCRENKYPVLAKCISRLHDDGKAVFAVLNGTPCTLVRRNFFQMNRILKFLDTKKFKSVLNGKKILHIAITLKNGVAK